MNFLYGSLPQNNYIICKIGDIFSKKSLSYNQTLEQVQGNKNYQIWKFKAVVTKNVEI